MAEHTSRVFWLGSQLPKAPSTKCGPLMHAWARFGIVDPRGAISSTGGFEPSTVKGEWLREFPDFLFLCLLNFHPRLVFMLWKPWAREPETCKKGEPCCFSSRLFPKHSELVPSLWQRQKVESIGEFSLNPPRDLRVTFFVEKFPESQRGPWRD